jgi:hypothetical protein
LVLRQMVSHPEPARTWATPCPLCCSWASPDLQVQGHLSPVALVSVGLDAVHPGTLQEMPEGWGEQALTAGDSQSPGPHWAL